MNGKYCSSSNHRKNGYSPGFHGYNCKNCGRNWTMRQRKMVRIRALKH